MEGPVYGAAKTHAITSADAFLLPSHSENFGIVVAEALAHGVPVLTTTATPWQALESEHCGRWIDDTPEAIAKALDIALSLPDAERAAMGARGRAWMRRDFSWNRIAKGMAEVYAWRLGWGAKPSYSQLVDFIKVRYCSQ